MENTFGLNIIPANEQQRLEALRRFNILDTPPEESFDRLAKLTAQIFNIPIALVSFVAEEDVFFKANKGMGTTRYTSRGISLCALAILNKEVTVFENPTEEPCLLANPLVTGQFGLKFYAAAPLITRDGFTIGSICIIDKKPRYFHEQQKEMLQQLAAIVMDQLEGRLALQTIQEKLTVDI